MTRLNNSRFIRALQRQTVDRTPVWIMRQAGRYLPEYRDLRQKAGDFLGLCKTPEFACEATLLPLRRFDLDAAILFSDILLIPDALGLGLHFVADEGPKFERTISSAADVAQLPTLDPDIDLGYVQQAIKLLKQNLPLELPLIGFSGSPWTVATYMVEGQTSKQFNKIKGFMYQDPRTLHKLLEHLTKQITSALQAQINAGVDAIMLFDTWGGILNDVLYREFSLRYMQNIIGALKDTHPNIPIILFTKNGGRCLTDIAATGCQAIGLDWVADLHQARIEVGNQVALQGNMDPAILYADAARIEDEVKRVLAQFGAGSGHIFNLGHGITPDVKPEHVQILIDAVKKYSPAYHQQAAVV